MYQWKKCENSPIQVSVVSLARARETSAQRRFLPSASWLGNASPSGSSTHTFVPFLPRALFQPDTDFSTRTHGYRLASLPRLDNPLSRRDQADPPLPPQISRTDAQNA